MMVEMLVFYGIALTKQHIITAVVIIQVNSIVIQGRMGIQNAPSINQKAYLLYQRSYSKYEKNINTFCFFSFLF
jgi:hypothetical protein